MPSVKDTGVYNNTPNNCFLTTPKKTYLNKYCKSQKFSCSSSFLYIVIVDHFTQMFKKDTTKRIYHIDPKGIYSICFVSMRSWEVVLWFMR
jgi:hypothetical protein